VVILGDTIRMELRRADGSRLGLLERLGLTRHDVRFLAQTYRLRHSAACREENSRRGGPYRCGCDFFEAIEQAALDARARGRTFDDRFDEL
jgi:hypothetical protein